MEWKDIPENAKRLYVIRLVSGSGKKYVRIVDARDENCTRLAFEVNKEFDGDWKEIPFKGQFAEHFEEINSLSKQ